MLNQYVFESVIGSALVTLCISLEARMLKLLKNNCSLVPKDFI